MPEAIKSGAPLLHLLFVEDARTDYALLVRLFEVAGHKLQSARVETVAQLRAALTSAHWDAVISELDLPDIPYTSALQVLREAAPDLPFIVVSSTSGEDVAVEAVIAGADDYVLKSRLSRLVPALQRSIAAAAARREQRADHARLRLLSSHLEQVNDVKRIARELHDSVGDLMADLAADFLWLSGNAEGDAVKARLQDMQQAFDRTRAHTAHTLRALRSPLMEIGIVGALHALAQNVSRRQGMACDFAANRASIVLEEAAFSAVYGVCQESLSILARLKHTKSVHIEVFAHADTVTLEVSTEDVEAFYGSLSLATFRDLREAVARLGGWLEVSGAASQGSSVMLSLPLKDASR